ncbi:MAG: phosphopantothenoylcysteine decarboxylase/phosphopantothenate--cysteine ligase [Planctomycetota bacterium]|jgi:phosphopantothenoylcysteine decarboxylase/phosphopantothenate--cysteine ligase
MKQVLLGSSASVAVYKACDLASRLTQSGVHVRTILTPNAARMISPQLFEAVSGQPAQVDEFGEARKTSMDHIELARFAQLVVVAPASADLIGRVANGIASDLLSTALLAIPVDVPRLLCPAMNPVMFAAPAVQRNLARLSEDGWEIVEPGAGHMACGEEGPGRLAEPIEIAARVLELLGE